MKQDQCQAWATPLISDFITNLAHFGSNTIEVEMYKSGLGEEIRFFVLQDAVRRDSELYRYNYSQARQAYTHQNGRLHVAPMQNSPT